MTLSRRAQAFIEGVVAHGNATRAAKEAGYGKAGAHAQGSRMLRNVKVAAEIARRRKTVVAQVEAQTGITLARVVEQLARIGFGDPAELFGADGKVLAMWQIPAETRPAIARFEAVEKGDAEGQSVFSVRSHKIRMVNKVPSLIAIGKHLGGFRDRVEVDDVTRLANAVPLLSDQELAQVRAALDVIEQAAARELKVKGAPRG